MARLFRTHLRLALTSVRENRTRSFLTCLGIAIGIASIILILSLTGSVAKLISTEISDIGQDLIVVRPSTTKDGLTTIVEELTSSNSFQKSNLEISDVAEIKKIEKVTAVAPIAITHNTVTDEENTISSATILGTNVDFNSIEPQTFRYGGFFTDKNRENSIVIGPSLSLHLYNTTNPVGRTLLFHDKRFIVVGVMEDNDATINFDNVDFNSAIIMDIKVLEELVGSLQVQQINVKVESTSDLEETKTTIKDKLTSKKSGDTNFTVTYGDDITHPASNLLNIISGMLSLVAGISLIVGGVGVMNIMLVSVAERAHEIGIRKAVGASSSNILMQFMFEALILSVLGGILGIILGYVLAIFVSSVTPFAPYVSWEIIAITFLTAVVVGIIFGIYPALKAASKNPIDSLKHYR
ncbi:ABC transporter permease [Candidatus Saccharibacteria bacterium]|nr:ABC transporter permease [Candidatus Saccharibacteria bacterium]